MPCSVYIVIIFSFFNCNMYNATFCSKNDYMLAWLIFLFTSVYAKLEKDGVYPSSNLGSFVQKFFEDC